DGVDAGARAVLANADHLELLSLEPGSARSPRAEKFHGTKVLGKTVIDSAADRHRLFLALNKGNAETTAFRGSCFNPRHGMRASGHGRTADLEICFQCGVVIAHLNGEYAGHFLTSASPQPVFDDLLRKAGIPLARKPDGR